MLKKSKSERDLEERTEDIGFKIAFGGALGAAVGGTLLCLGHSCGYDSLMYTGLVVGGLGAFATCGTALYLQFKYPCGP